MNNDDFLTKHKMRPDADFVENLYQKLQQNEKQVIRMNANPFRFKRWHTFASAFAFAGITILAALYWATVQTPNNHLITVRQNQFEPIAVFPSIEDLRADQPELIEGVINNNQNEAASDTSTNKPDQYRIDGLVNEPQKFNNQGPANLAIVLSFYGDETTQDEAASNLKPNAQDRNVSPWEISQFVNDYTELSAIARSNGSSELLKDLIANDFPVVIETGFEADIAGEASWYGHYRVIYGFDDVKQMFNTIDTFLGPFTERDVNNSGDQSLADGYTISYDQLLTDWQQFNYTFYVVYESTRKDKLLSILGEDYITETANWRAAVERAEADVSLAPENAFAWFNLGTSLTRLGLETRQESYFEDATEAFDQALSIGLPDRMLWYQHGPFSAYIETGRYQDALNLSDTVLTTSGGQSIEEVWLYRGHVQSSLQDYEAALKSYNQAIALNEYFYPAQFSKEYIESLLGSDH